MNSTTEPHLPNARQIPSSCAGSLGDYLVSRGRLTAEQLAHALNVQQASEPWKPLGQIITEQGWMSSARVIQDLADLTCKPYLDVSPEMVTPEALHLLPAEYLDKHNLLPICATESLLTIAMERFTDVLLTDDIARKAQRDVIAVAATPEAIREARRSVMQSAQLDGRTTSHDSSASLTRLLESIEVDELQVIDPDIEPEPSVEAASPDSPNVKLVNFILKSALDVGASDIHIEPREHMFRVRYRVDGDLVTSIQPSARLLPAVVSRIKILAGMDISERRMPQDGGVTVKLLNRAVDLRISTMATRFGEKVVMRIMNRHGGLPALETLGMSGEVLGDFRRLCRLPNGMVLVTGPTGSGKSTTLYGALAELSTNDTNVSTIEDPIERVLPEANQFQIHHAAGFTFARALRSLLRQDPDVIMVGEIRDTETARLATEAALTGHLVLSTLHTNDAPTAIPRLINMGVDAFMVAAALRGVLAQRLVKKLCQRCAVPDEPAGSAKQWLEYMRLGGWDVCQPMRAPGCPACNQRGSSGRIGIFDILTLDEAQVSAVSIGGGTASKDSSSLPRPSGLLTDGLSKVRAGTIALDTLIGVVAGLEPASEGPCN